MQQNKVKDALVMGFALFAIFFGAGNLIFPPYLGQIAGTDWQEAMFGFLTTDPILPVMGLIAGALIAGEPDALGRRVSSGFGKTIAILAMLIIGPFLAVPRTAATVHEIAVLPTFPTVPAYVTSLIFFTVTFILIFNQGRVIDIIGEYLTPFLLLVLAILIGKTIVSPIGSIAAPAKAIIGKSNTYFAGFREGYQTMDALGAVLMAGIVTADMIRRGYDSPKKRFKLTIVVALIACSLLALVYGGLTYVGATASTLFPAGEFTRVELLLGIASAVLGDWGVMVMAICVSVACLTTSIGLTAMVGDFFSDDIFEGKIRYKVIVTISVFLSFIVSIMGTEQIINVSVPILNVIYPIFVVLIFLTLFNQKIPYNQVYIAAVGLTLLISLETTAVFVVEEILKQNLAESAIAFLIPLHNIIMTLPFAESGFAWLLPAVLGVVLGFIWGISTKKQVMN